MRVYGPGEHALHRAGRQRLRPPPPVDGHGPRPAHRAHHHRLVVVAVSVRADEAAPGEAGHRLGEVRDHVPAVLLAVHQDVEAELLLGAHPELGRLALQAVELGPRDGVARGLGPGLDEIVGLREAADGGGGQDRQVQAETAELRAAHRGLPSRPACSRAIATMFSSFARARALGRSSSPQDGPRPTGPRRPGSTRSRIRRRASRDSSFVFRPSTTPEHEGPRRAGLGDPVRQLGPVGEVEPDEVHRHRHEIVPQRERVAEVGVEREVRAPAGRRQRGEPLADEVGVLGMPEEVRLVHLDHAPRPRGRGRRPPGRGPPRRRARAPAGSGSRPPGWSRRRGCRARSGRASRRGPSRRGRPRTRGAARARAAGSAPRPPAGGSRSSCRSSAGGR